MAVKLLKVGGVYNTPVKEFICEKDSDLRKLSSDDVVLGDRAYVVENGNWYVYSETYDWAEEGEPASGPK